MATASRAESLDLVEFMETGTVGSWQAPARYKGLRPPPRAARAQDTATRSQAANWVSEQSRVTGSASVIPEIWQGYPGLANAGARCDSNSLRDDERGSNQPDPVSWRPKAKHRSTRAAYSAPNYNVTRRSDAFGFAPPPSWPAPLCQLVFVPPRGRDVIDDNVLANRAVQRTLAYCVPSIRPRNEDYPKIFTIRR
jgi:hypothetical protein